MKKKYYVSRTTQPNGDHEVHAEGCTWLPFPDHRIVLGEYLSCHPAVLEAKRYYNQVNGCKHCSDACHTQ